MRALFFSLLGPGLLLLTPLGVPGQASAPTGNVGRGQELFLSYKCFACHGYSGETGSPRLVPMVRNQDSFINFVLAPTGAMPAFSDVPRERLADVYAYIRSIEPDAPPVEDIPLLNGLLREIQEED